MTDAQSSYTTSNMYVPLLNIIDYFNNGFDGSKESIEPLAAELEKAIPCFECRSEKERGLVLDIKTKLLSIPRLSGKQKQETTDSIFKDLNDIINL